MRTELYELYDRNLGRKLEECFINEAYELMLKQEDSLDHYINDFKIDTNFNLIIKKNDNRFHDRYIVIDYKTDNESIYHCGASSKDAGKKITTITKIEEKELYKSLIDEILNNDNLNI